MDLLQILAQKDLVAEQDIPVIKQEATAPEESIESVLLRRGIDSKKVLEAKGEQYNLPTRDLTEESIPFEVLKNLPEKTIERYQVLPLAVEDGALEVGFVDPDDLSARDAVQFVASKSGIPYKVYVILEKDFEKTHESGAGLSSEVNTALTELETELSAEKQDKKDSQGEDQEEGGNVDKITEDAPVTKIVATILQYAVEGRASDIHIEPLDDQVRVRFRVDGSLKTSLNLPKKVENAAVARIKILSNLKLDEKRKPQDGRFSAHIDGRKIDFRVSTFPTYYGEKVVMRILDTDKGVIALDEMGLTKRNLSMIRRAIQQPYGLILISGPTGSGKTTTLYSMLEEVDRETKNVLSLEDPVEYNIPGMSQSQVRPEIGYTFATGLRTTLRQDPDIIMVGEIRDKETAGLAIQAALTGHLVLSTIHTNTAIGVIPRLIDMGVDPYLIAPTLILAIAQRLVKKLCPDGGKKVSVEGSVEMMINKQFQDLPEEYHQKIEIPDHIYSINPSPECPNGTRGRTAVFEILEMNKDIEQVVLNKPNEVEIEKVARQQGMMRLREDALLKAFDGVVPLEEVNKL